MDDENHDRKRLRQIARALVETFGIIRAVLINLDQINLREYAIGPGVTEEMAGDLMTVAKDILPTVEARSEILMILRSVLFDWVILNDLVTLSGLTERTPRRIDAMEELSERLVLSVGLLSEIDPDLFRDIE